LKSEPSVRYCFYFLFRPHAQAHCRWDAVTALAAGRVGDIIGRKGTLLSGAVIFTIGGAIQTWTTGFYMMIVGRVVSGLGVGLLSCVLSSERH
jgi:MFS family permease